MNLSADDLLLRLIHRLNHALWHRIQNGSDTNAVVLQVVVDNAGFELALFHSFDGVEHGGIDTLHCAREDGLRRQIGLVRIDSDGVDARVLRSRDGSKASSASVLEDDVGSLRDFVLGDLAAHRCVVEVVGVLDQDVAGRVFLLKRLFETGDIAVDWRYGLSADHANRIFRIQALQLVLLLQQSSHHAYKVSGLFGLEDRTRHVWNARDGVIDDHEVRLWIFTCNLLDRIIHEVTDCDHQLVPFLRKTAQVWNVVRFGVGLNDRRLYTELLLRAIQSNVRQMVETVIVQSARIRDETNFDGRYGSRAGSGRAVRVVRRIGGICGVCGICGVGSTCGV